MNTIEFNKLVNELEILAQSTMNHKGPEYTNGSDDVLNNFKTTAAKAGVDPLTVWYIFFDKQVSSVASHVSNHDLNKAEPMISRFGDIINYAKLGYALFVERDRL